MKSSSVITLDKKALQSNWDFLRTHFKDKKISAVVKGNAYGHGIETYVPMAEACGVNHFSVFNAPEAYRVFGVASPQSTIMIMGALDDADMAWAIENDVEFYVFNTERIETAAKLSKKLGKKAIVHVEVETGMFRTGFEESQRPYLIDFFKENKDHVVFKGLCMHFAGAENIANYVRVKKQKINFKRAIKAFEKAGIVPEIIHACCSAAAMRLPDMHYDMLRIGIMQYGFWSGPEIRIEYLTSNNVVRSPLKRILSWESSIMSFKEVPPGEFIGYGASFYSHQPMRLALVPVGYAHGFGRNLSNSGIVLINRHRAPVIGTVNMNCIAIDVTGIDSISLNETVTLIGEQGEHEISVASFGEMTNQLNYELLTRLPVNIVRKVV